MTTTTVTIKHKITSELKAIDCGIEGKDYLFVSDCTKRIELEYPDYAFVSRLSVSDTPINFVRPLTYGF